MSARLTSHFGSSRDAGGQSGAQPTSLEMSLDVIRRLEARELAELLAGGGLGTNFALLQDALLLALA